MEEPESGPLHPGFLVRLMQKPVWLLGLGADALAYATQAAALGVGRLVSVQPLLVAERRLRAAARSEDHAPAHRAARDPRRGLRSAPALRSSGSSSTPYGGHNDASAAGWIIGIAIIGGACAALRSRQLGPLRGVRATLLGIAAGMLLGGIVAALTKATVDRFDEGITPSSATGTCTRSGWWH